jgi:hypothetical protein
VTVVVRPEGIGVAADGTGSLTGQVVEKSFRGSRSVVVVRVGQAELTAAFPAAQALPAVGEALALRLGPAAVQVLPEDADG